MRPFVWHDGRPYLVTTFDLEPTTPPELVPLLEGLLRHHPPQDLLLLRPLSAVEAKKLKQATANSEVDTWAQMVVVPEDRLRARPVRKGGRR
jgi:hypothetical protein